MADPLSDAELAFLMSMLDAARDGRTDELGDAVESGLPVNLTAASGDTLLILAAYHNHPGTVRALLDAGADPERINDRGQTALGAAVFRQSRDSVQALLTAGANPRTGGRSALDIAEFFELPAMRTLLENALSPGDRQGGDRPGAPATQ